MVKVIHFIHGLTMGGAETLVKDYVLGLDKTKFNVTVLCSVKYGVPYEKLLEEAGIRCIYINDYSKRKPNLFGKVFISLTRYIKVKSILRKEAPDILHVHLGLCRLVKFSRVLCTVFYTVHATPDFVWSGVPSEERAVRWLIKYRNMQFITLHEEMRNEVNARFGINNSLVLNNGINFEKYATQIDRNKIITELGIPADRTIIGHIGRFRDEKNHDFLIEIFQEYKKINEKAFLLMIGDGELKTKIIDRLNNMNMENDYLILSNRTDVPDLLRIMDYFVFPSKVEGLGIVLIESQRAGVRTLAPLRVVPKETCLSNLIKYISIDESASTWAKEIQNFPSEEIKYNGIDQCDMKSVVKRLEEYYLNSLTQGV